MSTSPSRISPRSTTLRHLQANLAVANEKANNNIIPIIPQRLVPVVNLLPQSIAESATKPSAIVAETKPKLKPLFLTAVGNVENNNAPSVIAVARESSFLSSNNDYNNNGRRSSGQQHSCAACGAPSAQARISNGGTGGNVSNNTLTLGSSSSPKSSARASHLLSKIGQAVSATVEQTTHQLSQQAGLSARHLHEAMGNALEWQQQHEHMHYYYANELNLTPSEQQLLVVAKAVEEHRLDPLSVVLPSHPEDNVVQQRTKMTKFHGGSSVRGQQQAMDHKPHSIAEAKLLGPRPQQLLNERFSNESSTHPHSTALHQHQHPPHQRFRPVTHFDEPECSFRISGSAAAGSTTVCLSPAFNTSAAGNVHHHNHRAPPLSTTAGVYHPLPAEMTRIPSPSDHHPHTTMPTTTSRSESTPMKSPTSREHKSPSRDNMGSGVRDAVSPHYDASTAAAALQLRVQDSSSETKLITLRQQRLTAGGVPADGGGGGLNEGFLNMIDAALLNTSFGLYAPRSTPPPPLSVVLEAQQRLKPKNPSLLHVPTPSATALQIVAAPPVVVPVQPAAYNHYDSFAITDGDDDDLLARVSDNIQRLSGGGGRLPSSTQRREFFSTNPWLSETRQRFRRYFTFVYVSLALVMLLFWLENIIAQTQLRDKVALENVDLEVKTFAYRLLLASLGQEAQFAVWNSAGLDCKSSSICVDDISRWQAWTDASLRVAHNHNENDASFVTNSTSQAISKVRSSTAILSPDEVCRLYFDLFAALTLGTQQSASPQDFDIMRSAHLYYLIISLSASGSVVLYPQRLTNSSAYQHLQTVFHSTLHAFEQSITVTAMQTAEQRRASDDTPGKANALLFTADNSLFAITAYASLQKLRAYMETSVLLLQNLDDFHALPSNEQTSRLTMANSWMQYIIPWSTEISRLALMINLVEWFPPSQTKSSFDAKVAALEHIVENYQHNGGIRTGGTSNEIFNYYWRRGLRIELFFIVPVLLMLFAVVFLEWRSRGTLGVLLTILFEAVYDASRTNVDLERARAISHRLILHHFPPAIAKRLFDTNVVMPESYLMSTIMFVEIDSFNLISQYSTPTEIVHFLDGYYETLESLLRRHPLVTQIHTTLMSTHLLASGIPTRTLLENEGESRKNCEDGNLDDAQDLPSFSTAHAFEACTVALEILRQFYYFCIPHFVGPYGARSRLHLRVGCHSGTAVAAVVGVNQIRYSVFGDTVNLASRMQDYGYPRLCVMSRDTFRELEAYDPEHGSSRHFITKSRGEIRMKGKGRVAMMWLLGSARLQFSLDVKKEKYLYNVHCLAMHKPTECVLFRPGKAG